MNTEAFDGWAREPGLRCRGVRAVREGESRRRPAPERRARGSHGHARRASAIAGGLLLLAACAPAPGGDGAAEQAKAAEPAVSDGAWQVLFDGRDLSQWRGYGREDVPSGWRIRDGVLAFDPAVDSAGRGDLVTREQYGDFELELEWKISEGGNSGIFYRATEDAPTIYETGPEMQILDDARHVDGQNPLTSAGANYALHAPAVDAVRPVGEWNAVRILARGSHVEYWLNGQKVVEYEQWSDDWKARVAESKFAAMPGYGKAKRGYIGLQDHGNPVWFRNIRVRRLDGAR